MAWDNFERRWIIQDARIVVAVESGGAIVEHRTVEYREGRFVSQGDGTRDDPPSLVTFHSLSIPGAPEPDSMVGSRGRIVVDGCTEDGRMEMRGDGEISYDEHGNLEVVFNDFPQILLDAVPPPAEPAGPDRRGLSYEEWFAHLENNPPKPSAEYWRATRATEPYEE